jgi:hypothetical protein
MRKSLKPREFKDRGLVIQLRLRSEPLRKISSSKIPLIYCGSEAYNY